MKVHPRVFGSEDTLSVSGYPEIVDPYYLDAWAEYIRTQTACDLYNYAPRPYGMSYAVMGFLSYISSLSNSVLLKTVKSPLDYSISAYTKSLTEQKNALGIFLKNMSFDRYFRLSDVKVVHDSHYNIVSNMLMVELSITLIYSPKPESGKPVSIGRVLRPIADSWFKGKRPIEVFDRSPLTEVYAKNPKLKRPDVYPNVSSLLVKRKGWHLWDQKLGLEIARIQGNALALRITTNRMPVFIGSKAKNQVLRKLTNLATTRFK